MVWVQLQPEAVAVIVTVAAASSALNVTDGCTPVLGVSSPLPAVIAQVAGLPVIVSVTSTPAPIFVRARSAGEVATVRDVNVHPL
jgi:hypothetical protein